MSTRILYLSYDGLTDPLGQSQILPYAIGLAAKGYCIKIVSFEKPKAYDRIGAQVRETCRQYSIAWHPLTYHHKPPVLSTLYDLWILFRCVKKEYVSWKFQIVHCRSYVTALAGLRAKRRWGVKFIFDMRGFWPDERVEGNLWNLTSPIYKSVYGFFKRKERQFLKEASHVISLTRNAMNEIKSWNIEHAPITVIPTCVDLNLFDRSSLNQNGINAMRRKLKINAEDYVILYLGSWGTWYLTDQVLHFYETIRSVRPDAKLLIVSPDQIALDEFRYKDDVIITSVQRADVPLVVSLAHLAVCFIKPTFSKKASSATKIGELLAMGVPVVVNRGWGDIDALIDQNCGVYDKNDFDINVLEKIVDRKISDCAKQFSLTLGVARYDQVYRSLGIVG